MDLTTTVSRIVLDHPECARVLQERHIDFCCNGSVSLAEACAARGLDAREIAAELQREVRPGGPAAADDPRRLPTAELVAWIVSHHHVFLRDALPFLVPLAAKVAAVHGEHDSRLLEVQAKFFELRGQLDAHLDEEEETFFREVVAPAPDLGQLREEAAEMREEHREIGAALGRIRELTDDYTPPDWACTSYRRLLSGLRLLEDDVLRHVHLENEVLLPRLAAA